MQQEQKGRLRAPLFLQIRSKRQLFGLLEVLNDSALVKARRCGAIGREFL